MISLDVNFINPFIDGTLKTLGVQCSLEAIAGRPFIKGTVTQPSFDIAAIIGLTSKHFTGSIALQFTDQLYLRIMSNMLGEEYKEVTKDLQDGAAELLNIIFGVAKVALNEKGYSVQKAIPTFVRGRGIQTHQVEAAVLVVPFDTQYGAFHVEICAEAV